MWVSLSIFRCQFQCFKQRTIPLPQRRILWSMSKNKDPFSFTSSELCLFQIEVGKSAVTVSGAQSSKGDKEPWCSLLPKANPSGLSAPWLISECVTSDTPLSRFCIPRHEGRLTAEPGSVGAGSIWVANVSPCPFSIKLPLQKTIRSRGSWWVAVLQQHNSGSAARLLSVFLCVFEGRLTRERLLHVAHAYWQAGNSLPSGGSLWAALQI